MGVRGGDYVLARRNETADVFQSGRYCQRTNDPHRTHDPGSRPGMPGGAGFRAAATSGEGVGDRVSGWFLIISRL